MAFIDRFNAQRLLIKMPDQWMQPVPFIQPPLIEQRVPLLGKHKKGRALIPDGRLNVHHLPRFNFGTGQGFVEG